MLQTERRPCQMGVCHGATTHETVKETEAVSDTAAITTGVWMGPVTQQK